MKDSIEKIQDLRLKLEATINNTSQIQQVLAQIEASLSREENQKVTEKSRLL